MVLWGWVRIGGVGGHTFTAPRRPAVDSHGWVTLQLTTEPLTTDVVVLSLLFGAERPQRWREPIVWVLCMDMWALWNVSGRVWYEDSSWGRLVAPGLHGRLSAATRGSCALVGLYLASTGPGHHFLMATDH